MKPYLHPERLRSRRQKPKRVATDQRSGGPFQQGGVGFTRPNLGQT